MSAPDHTAEAIVEKRMSAAEIAEALARAKTFGVDLELLRSNLELSPVQRLERLQAGLRTWHALRHARRL